jgi:hypothetical protein
MDEAPPVGVIECAGRVYPNQRGLGGGEQVIPIEDRPQAATFQQFHHQKGRAIVLAPVIDPNDVRMAKSCDQAGFRLKATQERLVVGEGGVQQLDGNAPAEGYVLGHIDMS